MEQIKLYKTFQIAGCGLYPLLLLSVLSLIFSLEKAVLLSVLFSLLLSGFAFYYRRVRNSLPLYTITSVLLIYALFLFFISIHKLPIAPSFLLEILLLIHLGSILLARSFIKRFYRNCFYSTSCLATSLELVFFFFSNAFALLSFHLLISLLYGLYNKTFISSANLLFSFTWLLPLFILMYVIQFIYTSYVSSRLSQEDWVPLVDHKGMVIGKAPLNLLKEEDVDCMIPLVRIFLKYQDMFYLKHCYKNKHKYGKVDIPIESFLNYGEALNQCVFRQLDRFGLSTIESTFLLKYRFDLPNTKMKCLVYLYQVEIFDPNVFRSSFFKGGKLWTKKQIKENIGMDYFCQQIESDFSFLFLSDEIKEKFDKKDVVS